MTDPEIREVPLEEAAERLSKLPAEKLATFVRKMAPGKPRTIWDDAHMRYWRCRCVGSAGRRYRNIATAKTCTVCGDKRPPRNRYK